MERRFLRFVETHDLFTTGETVVVGVSGGIDSMVLVHLLQQLELEIVVAHVNYQLRGAASDADQAMVQTYCRNHNLTYESRSFDTASIRVGTKGSVQMLARQLRYDFFKEVARETQSAKIAVAHQADDQVETVLLHLFRGTGIQGLAGMPVRRMLQHESGIELVRPLLFARRNELRSFAEAEQIPWREDESNRDPQYRRGALRSIILPSIQAHFGEHALSNVLNTSRIVRAYWEDDLAPQLQERFALCSRPLPGARGCIQLDALETQAEVWQQRILLEALHRWLPYVARTTRTLDRITALIQAQAGKKVAFESGAVWKGRNRLVFVSHRQHPKHPEPIPVKPGQTVPCEGGRLSIEEIDTWDDYRQVPEHVVYIDATHPGERFRVRTWRPGDRFQPLGMTGWKKVSDFLTDQKVPVHLRDRVQVLEFGEHIVWVIGYRLAHPFRIRPETKKAWRVSLTRREDQV